VYKVALIIFIDIIVEIEGLDDHSADPNYFRGLFEAVAGYALGTSLVSIFTRVSGSVFATSSEFGAELVGKMEGGMPYNNSHNPATIA
jgi:Na+/H+-translocating membrane pyrophosphatase